MTTTSENPVGRILVVDDELELKNALVDALSAQSFDVCGFTSGKDALGALRTADFDLLISDLMMPEMDGIELIKAALEIDPHLVAIIMTGQGTIQTAVEAMQAGTVDYVLKPFRLQTLMPILTRAINTRRLRKENLQLRETLAIYELAQTIAFTLDPQTLISKLADAALQQTDADEVSVLLPTDDGAELYVAAVRGDNRKRLLGERIPLKEGIASWVARERMPLILNGEVHDERFVAQWPRPEIRSAVSVPMQVANKLVGIINLNVINGPRPFTLGQMKALTILASTGAAALESASLYTKVQRAEENYRSIFDNAIEGIFQSTPEGRFLAVNPAMARILGHDSPEDLIASITDVATQLYVDPADRDRAAQMEKEGGVVHAFEFEAYRKDREKIWLSLNRRSVQDEKGVGLYREGSIENITERKRAEQALKSSEAEVRALFAAITDVIIVFDADGRYLKIAPTNSTDSYKPPDDLIGRTQHEIFPKETADFLVSHIRLALDEGRAHRLEYRLELEGTEVWFDGSVAPLSQNSVIWIARDITERKRAEAELRQSEERYRDLVENAHDIIYSHDLEGNYTSMNKAAELITGYTPEEALCMNLSQMMPAEYLPTAQEMVARKLAGEKVTAYETELIAKDGHRVAVEANTKLVFQNGLPVGVQGIARDVTHRKNLEDQLRQSQKLEGIGQLAGGIAHDFNNLLTAINGYSSLALQRIEGNPSVRIYLEEIKKAGDRAANLTRQLLAFGRKQILQPLPLNLNDIVTDMSKMLRRLIGEDIDLTAKLDPELQKIQADPGQVEQVLVNLIVNARDAMPQGGKLTIETTNVELDREYASTHVGANPGAYVVLAVSDTGTGMNEQVRQQIFEPFFTTKEKGKGTGLGLSTVYGVVKQSGGNIWVYSEPNHGTTFKVYLPALASASSSSEPKAADSPVPRGSETVLLVEDEEVVRGLARQILEEAGYRVLVAQQGEEAVRFCNEHANEIHLLLTDVVMPGAGGKVVADRLSAMRPGIKVLFMSGYTDEAIVHHGVLDSNVEFIQKPFTPLGLSKKVREVLDSNGHAKGS